MDAGAGIVRSQLNLTFLGYFDPINITLYDMNNLLLGDLTDRSARTNKPAQD